MIIRLTFAACWLLSCGALYFFENNTGTRAVLLMAAAAPLIFWIKRRVKTHESLETRVTETEKPDMGSVPKTYAEPGDIREYATGDPVSRIHWKLTAKTGRLLIREDSMTVSKEIDRTKIAEYREETVRAPRKRSRIPLIVSGAVAALCLLLIAVIPGAQNGFLELCNRLFDLSESLNRYVYERFAVPDGQSVLASSILLAAAATAWAALTAFARSRVPALITAAALAVFQVYFGVSLPAWANIPLFFLLGIKLFSHGAVSKRSAAYCAAAALAIVIVLVFFPGIDARMENASERVRDRFSESADASSLSISEAPANGFETRHVNTRSLLIGANESISDKNYRLVTVDEQQISMPHFINYLRAVMMSLLAIVVIVLPFAPFVVINARRRKTRAHRAAFDSEDVSRAVRAMFLHTVIWLRDMRLDAGNALFAEWPETLAGEISGDYASDFGRCAKLFEEAEYSDHLMHESAREEMRALVEATENELYPRADLRTRLRLKYVECLVE